MSNSVGVHRGFTDDEVREIREIYAEHRSNKAYWGKDRMNYKNLALIYGVSLGAIAHIVTRKTYQHVK